MLGYIFLGFILCSVSGFKFPRPDPRCDVKDFECMAEITRKLLKFSLPGIQDLGTLPLDPLHLDLIEKNSTDLEFSLKDTTVTGLKHSNINEVTIIIKENKDQYISFDITMPRLKMAGNYKLNGKIFTMPVKSEGKYFFEASNVQIYTTTLKHIYDQNGKMYLELTKIDTKTDLLGDIHFDANSLFEGNKALFKPVLKFMNDNAQDVAELWKEPVAKAVLGEIFGSFNKILATVAIAELIANPYFLH